MTAIKNPVEQYLHTGDYSLKEHLKETGKSALLGAGIGAAGAIPNRALALAGEVGVLGQGGAWFEGRKATAEDWMMAAGVIGGLRMSKVVRRAISDIRSGAPAEEVAARAKEAFLGSTAPAAPYTEKPSPKAKQAKNVGLWQPEYLGKKDGRHTYQLKNSETGEVEPIETGPPGKKQASEQAGQLAAMRNTSATPEAAQPPEPQGLTTEGATPAQQLPTFVVMSPPDG